jgi:hypothetical protein
MAKLSAWTRNSEIGGSSTPIAAPRAQAFALGRPELR